MKPRLLLLALLLIGFIVAIGNNNTKNTPDSEPITLPPATRSAYSVRTVIDGDTIIAETEGEMQTVRLLGIDTPEVDPQYNPIECYGREATNATKEKLLNQTVTLENDDTQGTLDKFGRVLAYVFLPDGTNVNQYLITEGFAKEYTYNKPYKYQKEFRIAEKEAQIGQKGLWSPGLCPENS